MNIRTIGTVPSSLCNIPVLSNLNVTSSGNTNMTCIPFGSCLTSVTINSLLVCPSFQDESLCGFISATDIASKSGYDEWFCNSNGYTLTDPCSPLWTGVVCSGGFVDHIDVYNLEIEGIIYYLILFYLSRFNFSVDGYILLNNANHHRYSSICTW